MPHQSVESLERAAKKQDDTSALLSLVFSLYLFEFSFLPYSSIYFAHLATEGEPQVHGLRAKRHPDPGRGHASPRPGLCEPVFVTSAGLPYLFVAWWYRAVLCVLGVR